jgi:hypothetical protein
MRGQHDGAAPRAELAEQGPELPPRLRVEPGGRLVQKQQIGIPGKRVAQATIVEFEID